MQRSFDEYWKVIGPLRPEIESTAAVMEPLATIQWVVEQLQCTLLALRTSEDTVAHRAARLSIQRICQWVAS
jgi:hypothetical protein